VSLILLLDLDDTLLENNIEEFLPRYLGAFANEVASFIDPNRFIETLLAGTREMVKNRRPDCTLKETFDAAFFPALGVEAGQFQGFADKFYEEVFPTLQGLTHPIPEAVHLVEQAELRGYRMAIATNPLFPLTAVLQRLAWANLPVEKHLFEVIASYETFHFTKPDPAFFVEVLGRMGWPSGAVAVVGDDIDREIIASRKLGLSAFWIPRRGATPPDGHQAPTAKGKLEDVLPWLDSTPVEELQPLYDTPYTMLAIMRATPAIMDSFCRNLVEAAWRVNPREGEWCMTEIVCHLRDVDMEVNLPRLKKVLQENNPFLPGEDTDPWASQRHYAIQDGRQALRQFIASRMEILDILEAIKPEDWERPARHAIFGPTRLVELVNIIAGHDRLHVRQAYELLG
jgi:FMN phosphatase YigB (HAD superfamily)